MMPSPTVTLSTSVLGRVRSTPYVRPNQRRPDCPITITGRLRPGRRPLHLQSEVLMKGKRRKKPHTHIFFSCFF